MGEMRIAERERREEGEGDRERMVGCGEGVEV